MLETEGKILIIFYTQSPRNSLACPLPRTGQMTEHKQQIRALHQSKYLKTPRNSLICYYPWKPFTPTPSPTSDYSCLGKNRGSHTKAAFCASIDFTCNTRSFSPLTIQNRCYKSQFDESEERCRWPRCGPQPLHLCCRLSKPRSASSAHKKVKSVSPVLCISDVLSTFLLTECSRSFCSIDLECWIRMSVLLKDANSWCQVPFQIGKGHCAPFSQP